jgi:hypothetical protein
MLGWRHLLAFCDVQYIYDGHVFCWGNVVTHYIRTVFVKTWSTYGQHERKNRGCCRYSGHSTAATAAAATTAATAATSAAAVTAAATAAIGTAAATAAAAADAAANAAAAAAAAGTGSAAAAAASVDAAAAAAATAENVRKQYPKLMLHATFNGLLQ